PSHPAKSPYNRESSWKSSAQFRGSFIVSSPNPKADSSLVATIPLFRRWKLLVASSSSSKFETKLLLRLRARSRDYKFHSRKQISHSTTSPIAVRSPNQALKAAPSKP